MSKGKGPDAQSVSSDVVTALYRQALELPRYPNRGEVVDYCFDRLKAIVGALDEDSKLASSFRRRFRRFEYVQLRTRLAALTAHQNLISEGRFTPNYMIALPISIPLETAITKGIEAAELGKPNFYKFVFAFSKEGVFLFDEFAKVEGVGAARINLLKALSAELDLFEEDGSWSPRLTDYMKMVQADFSLAGDVDLLRSYFGDEVERD